MNADVTHQACHGGGLFHGEVEIFGAAQVLHGFAEHFQIDVRAAGGTGEDIRDASHCAIGFHIDLEGARDVGGDIRRAG